VTINVLGEVQDVLTGQSLRRSAGALLQGFDDVPVIDDAARGGHFA
jgi:hypothetical protein